MDTISEPKTELELETGLETGLESELELKLNPELKPETESFASTEHLLRHPKLWRAGQLAQMQGQARTGISSGYAQLDAHLPDSGWPAAGLAELLLTSAGLGELRLLAPALRSLSQSGQWIVWINPPFTLYAPALIKLGIDTRKILIIRSEQHKDALWALERACRSAACSSALAWLDEQKLRSKDTQRLQVAARHGRTFACLFRPVHAHAHASMAELRLLIHHITADGRTLLDIVKRRGGWPIEQVELPIAEITATQHQQTHQVKHALTQWRVHLAKRQALMQQEDIPSTQENVSYSKTLLDTSVTAQSSEEFTPLPASSSEQSANTHVQLH